MISKIDIKTKNNLNSIEKLTFPLNQRYEQCLPNWWQFAKQNPDAKLRRSKLPPVSEYGSCRPNCLDI
jgi:hypothetical protein